MCSEAVEEEVTLKDETLGEEKERGVRVEEREWRVEEVVRRAQETATSLGLPEDKVSDMYMKGHLIVTSQTGPKFFPCDFSCDIPKMSCKTVFVLL